MIHSLMSLPPKAAKRHVGLDLIPVELSFEERATMKICPVYRYSVSVFSCWQCEHFETHNRLTTEVTKCSGKCQFPRRASKESRKLTSVVALKVAGKLDAEESVESIREERRERMRKMHAKRKEGGGNDKAKLALECLQQTHDRLALRKLLLEKFPGISDAYISTIYYAAKKKIPNYQENSDTATKKVITDSKPKKAPAGLGYSQAVKLQKVREFLKQGKEKAEILSILAEKYYTSKAYAQVLYYQAKKLEKENT